MLTVFALVYTTSDVFTAPLATTATVGMVFLHAVTVSDFRFCLVRRRNNLYGEMEKRQVINMLLQVLEHRIFHTVMTDLELHR